MFSILREGRRMLYSDSIPELLTEAPEQDKIRPFPAIGKPFYNHNPEEITWLLAG